MSTPPKPTPKPDDTHSPDPGIPDGMDDKEAKGLPDSDRNQSETVPSKT